MQITSVINQSFGEVSFATKEQKQKILKSLDPIHQTYLKELQNNVSQQMVITGDGDVYIDDATFISPKRIYDDTLSLADKVIKGLRILHFHKILSNDDYSGKLCVEGNSYCWREVV